MSNEVVKTEISELALIFKQIREKDMELVMLKGQYDERVKGFVKQTGLDPENFALVELLEKVTGT